MPRLIVFLGQLNWVENKLSLETQGQMVEEHENDVNE